ncbi:hypothetical protein [Tsuneonella mangrovi]|uniref:hypothetical protein n=1 Tax=Tsuneonella mangrovi TaxID=1982042 RepID=UPI000BA2A2F6|nr:hypothetical protein [Tsuneonella mangrovi]
MIAASIPFLFAAVAIAALAVLTDGFVRGRNAWRSLQADLARLDSVYEIMVRFESGVETGCSRIPELRRVPGHAGRASRRPASAPVLGQRVAA